MWKIVILSAFLIAAQAADLKDIYGDWIQVAFYPIAAYIPVCIKFEFTEIPDRPHCTYSDGSNATLVKIAMLTEAGILNNQDRFAMLVVDAPEDVMPALNLTYKCGNEDMREHGVVRILNKDYFILYTQFPPSMSYNRSETEPNQAYLFSKKLSTADELMNVMLSISELKGRRGAQMCGVENWGGFKKNEV